MPLLQAFCIAFNTHCCNILQFTPMIMASDANNLIQKRNLWKFLKMVQVQNRPVYKILAGVPTSVIWIDILERDTNKTIQVLSISEFIEQLHTLPTKGAVYRINLKTYSLPDEEYDISAGESLFTASCREQLTLQILPSMLFYLCYQKVKARAPNFLECMEDIKKYKLTRKDMERLTPYISECNKQLIDKL